ncbi:UNVERIFIED_CONTAM: pimeloyl-ACP methyl ester carboxylesterase [Williamsia faeni]
MTAETSSPITEPRWFAAALANKPEHRDVQINGSRVHLRCWGDEGRPGVVLVHGGSAHSGWWDHIAPLLASSHRVVAIDLSGHGDSEIREQYPMDQWTSEVIEVAKAGGISGKPYVVGHSMGGWVTAILGATHNDAAAGLVIIDSPLFDEPPEEIIIRQLARVPKAHPNKEEICVRFRTEPRQDTLLPYVARHVAEESVKETEAGWVWKFDPEMFRKRHEAGRMVNLRELLTQIVTPSLYIRCELGMVSPEMAQEIAGLFANPATVVDLPDAGHHPMFDQPLPLVAILRTVLAQWDSAR